MSAQLKYCEVKYTDFDQTHLCVGVKVSEFVGKDLIHEFLDLDFNFEVNDSDDDSLQFIFKSEEELKSAIKIIHLVIEELQS